MKTTIEELKEKLKRLYEIEEGEFGELEFETQRFKSSSLDRHSKIKEINDIITILEPNAESQPISNDTGLEKLSYSIIPPNGTTGTQYINATHFVISDTNVTFYIGSDIVANFNNTWSFIRNK